MIWNSQTAETIYDQCCLFNDFFKSTFSSNELQTKPVNETPLAILVDYDVSIDATAKVTSSLDVIKSRGPDGLPPCLFKNTPGLNKSLSQLFYKIKQTQCFPIKWKEGAVHPSFKKGTKLQVQNYRPITLLNIASKVNKKLIFNALYPYISPLINNCQFRFTKGRSPVLQLIWYLDNIYKSIPNDTIQTVYLDFANAFDKVNHKILINKLQRLGFGGKLLGVICNYLTQRTQFVQMGDTKSPSLDVTSGVPQGSILGPLLFIIYVMDMPSELVTTPFMFADDTKLLSVHKSSISSILQNDLSHLQQWCSENCMEFNVDKCHIVTFSKNSPSKLQLYGMPLQRVRSEKDLGVIINDCLKWNEHINTACSKANRVLNLVKRNVVPLTTAANKLDLYKSMVVPVLTYGSLAWAPSRGDLRTIEQVQRRATRWILGYSDSDLHYRDGMVSLNTLPLSLNRQIYDLIAFLKLVKDDSIFPWYNHVQRCTSKHTTRNISSLVFKLPAITKEVQRQNFWYRAPRLYNIINDRINLYGPFLLVKPHIIKFFWDYYNSNYNELDIIDFISGSRPSIF